MQNIVTVLKVMLQTILQILSSPALQGVGVTVSIFTGLASFWASRKVISKGKPQKSINKAVGGRKPVAGSIVFPELALMVGNIFATGLDISVDKIYSPINPMHAIPQHIGRGSRY